MNYRIVLPSLLALFCGATDAFSAPANLDKEYEQVRSIALRDPKVRAAYDKADERLADKIVEIDPALKGYRRGQHPAASSPAEESHVKTKPFVKPGKPLVAKAQPAPAHSGASHVIATGDTLSTIAAHYKVTVAELKHANPTVDEKKLQVGQKLSIPGGHRAPSNPE